MTFSRDAGISMLFNSTDDNVLRLLFIFFQFLDIYVFYIILLIHHMHNRRVKYNIPTTYIGPWLCCATFFISLISRLIVSSFLKRNQLAHKHFLHCGWICCINIKNLWWSWLIINYSLGLGVPLASVFHCTTKHYEKYTSEICYL